MVKIFDACFVASCLRHTEFSEHCSYSLYEGSEGWCLSKTTKYFFWFVATEGKIICIDFYKEDYYA